MFDPELVDLVWEKAKIVEGHDPEEYRKDHCGAWIRRSMYGMSSGERTMGWEVSHIRPVSIGGKDVGSNLQALQWENNKEKGDNYPYWECKVVAMGGKLRRNKYVGEPDDLFDEW